MKKSQKFSNRKRDEWMKQKEESIQTNKMFQIACDEMSKNNRPDRVGRYDFIITYLE